jgi:hypothetical protein
MNELFKKKRAFAKMAKDHLERDEDAKSVYETPEMKTERSMKQFIFLVAAACGIMWGLFYAAFRWL